jgi:hypothetical protein
MFSPCSNRYAETKALQAAGFFSRKAVQVVPYTFMALTEGRERSTRPEGHIRGGLIVLTARPFVGNFVLLHLREIHSDNQATSATSSVHEIGSESLLTTTQVCRWLRYANAGIGLSDLSTEFSP